MAATSQRVVRIYANALYTAADQAGEVERVAGDLGFVRRTVVGSKDLERVFLGSITPDETKKKIISRLFASHVSTVTLKFLDLLIDKRREDVVESVEAAYRFVADQRSGVVRATVSSAVALTPQEIENTKAAIQKMTGKRAEIEQRIDQSIIGGLVIRVGDKLIDGSVKGQLEQLKHALAVTVR